jgi:hypothetical protein
MPTTTQPSSDKALKGFLDKEVKGFAAKYKEYGNVIEYRLKELDKLFGGSVPLLRTAMSTATGRNGLPFSFNSASNMLDHIKRVATPVIRAGDEKERETVYVFMNALLLFDDVNQRVRVASHIAEAMERVARKQAIEETPDSKDATKILAAINKTLGHPLSHSSLGNFEDAVEMAAAFENMARALKNPLRIIDTADILQRDWLFDLQRREKEGTD